MKTLISDKELLAYASGQCCKEETHKIHQKAINNGESDLLLHVQLATLACQEELADELLGVDDFIYENGLQGSLGMAAKYPSPTPDEE